jgi:hypothetical protein
VAGAAEECANAVRDRVLLGITAGAHQFECRFCVCRRIERQGWLVFRIAMAIGELRFFFLQVCGIEEENGEQVGGACGAVDWSVKSVAHQQRQVSRMIDMGVAEHHCIDRGGVEQVGVVDERDTKPFW